MATRQPARRPSRTAAARKPKTAAARTRTSAKTKAAETPAKASRGTWLAAAVGVAGAALAGLGYALSRRAANADLDEGAHRAPDLHPRAPEAFRPDPTAPVPEGERDAFRPALARPTLVESDRAAEPRADTAGGSTLSPQGGRVTEAGAGTGTPSQPVSATGIGNL